MLKYDHGSIKLTPTHKKILEHIEKDSVILECGCSSGYMTKYMSEELGCKVYIVEYEKESFDIAINYATDGICGDLMQDEWMIKFRGMKFDYILFADVLEHLYNPASVLRKAIALLKDDGKIIASLPNVGNNDVIAEIYNDNWRYTPEGLLDNTHIRFFGKRNLRDFFNEAGLDIIELQFNTKRINRTEQKVEYNNENSLLYEALSARAYGSVYQFIITTMKKNYVEAMNIEYKEEEIKEHSFEYAIYYSDSKSFAGKKKETGSFGIDGNLEIEIDNSIEKAKYIRIDPIEGMFGVVENAKVTYDGNDAAFSSSNGTKCNNMYLFKTRDPQLIIGEISENVSKINITMKVIPMNAKSQMLMIDKYIREYADKSNLEKELKKSKEKIKKLEKNIKENDDNIVKKIENINEQVIKKNNELEKKYNESLKKDDYLEKKIMEMERTLSWKVTKPIRKIKAIFKKKRNV